ncbi:MAG: Stk1 family PASTA domain-containing Ser/Thr kinase [Scardovia wiggsiae]|uniref:Stk1 family PASTA domain-containing Ser/Thr kinase n=1 Tax=Scardovia wiggsiae TaxID=230143 RepID=UPI00361F99E1
MSMFIPQSLAGGRYTVGELIGHGGMAQVHIGTDTRLGRTVAIKIMRSDLAEDSIFLTRFRREARAVAQLNNPNIVSIYDSGEEQLEDAAGNTVQVPYIVMEYIKGQTLRDIIQVNGSLSPQDAEQVMIGVLNALDYSHRMGIIHRDIKPGNIMISDQGTVKVMDFGIARAMDDSSATMTQNQGVVGTAQYLSPEQARGEQVGAKSDLYSAGCVLYEMLTGKPPFTGDSAVAIAYQHVSETATPISTLIPGLDKRWDSIVAKAMAKDTENRYADAAAFRQDIVTLAHGGIPIAANAHPLTDLSKTSQAQDVPQTAAMPQASVEQTSTLSTGSLPAAYGPAAADSASTPAAGTSTRALARKEEQDKKKRRNIIIISVVLGIAALAAIMLGIWFAYNSQNNLVSVPTIDSSMSASTAKETIESAGLHFQQETDDNSSEPRGTFTRQNPTGGTRVAKGSTVRVWFSSGPRARTIPNVKGMTQQAATSALTSAGFKVSSVATENSATVEKDHVTRTDPASGTQQPQGTSVILYISTGQTTVPTGLVGKSQNEAVRRLNNNGFNTNIMQENSDSVAAGNVTRVNPAEGSTVSQGATITVYISSGPKMIDTPSQSSLSKYAGTGSELKSYLRELGFTNVTISGNSNDPVDTVTFGGKKLENISDSQIASNTPIVITTGSAPDPEN